MIVGQVGNLLGYMFGEYLWKVDKIEKADLSKSVRIWTLINSVLCTFCMVGMSGKGWGFSLIVGLTIGVLARQSIEDAHNKRVYVTPCFLIALVNVIYGFVVYGIMPMAIIVGIILLSASSARLLGKPDVYCYIAVLFLTNNNYYQVAVLVIASLLVVIASIYGVVSKKGKLTKIKVAMIPLIYISMIVSYCSIYLYLLYTN